MRASIKKSRFLFMAQQEVDIIDFEFIDDKELQHQNPKKICNMLSTEDLNELLQSLIGVILRADLFLSPLALAFKQVEYCKEVIYKGFFAFSIIELIFLLDDGIALQMLFSRIKFDKTSRWHIRLLNNT